jgi:hypothetical protein
MVGAKLRNKGAEDSYNMLRALRGEIPTTPIREAIMPYAKEFSLREDHYKIDFPRSNDRGRPSQGRGLLYGPILPKRLTSGTILQPLSGSSLGSGRSIMMMAEASHSAEGAS